MSPEPTLASREHQDLFAVGADDPRFAALPALRAISLPALILLALAVAALLPRAVLPLPLRLLPLAIAGLPALTGAALTALSPRHLAEALQTHHLRLAPLPLLAHELAQLLELLPELLLLFLRRLLLVHPVEVLGALVEIVGARAQVLHQVLGSLLELAVEAVELAAGVLLLVALAIEALELTLLLLEQAALLVAAAVAHLLLAFEDVVGELLAALVEVLRALLGLFGRLLDGLAHRVELRLVDGAALGGRAHLLGELMQRIARLVELGVGDRLASRTSQVRLLELFADRLERLLERLVIGRGPVEELLLQSLHPPKGLGSIETAAGDVVDEPVELVDRRFGLVARVLLLHLLEKIFDVVEIVRSHLDGIDRLRVREGGVPANLEKQDADERRREHGRHRAVARPADGNGEARPGSRRDGHRVFDRRVHKGSAGRHLGERERVGEAVVECVKSVEPPSPRPLRQAPRPRNRGRPQHTERCESEHAQSRALRHDTHLARGDVRDPDDQGRTERLRTHTKGAVETDALLCVAREPTNLLDPVLVAGHR